MSNTPAVTFSLQPVVSGFPAELHECIDVTPELVAWAAEIGPAIRQQAVDAAAAERGALATSRGEASWRAASGPALARERDQLDHVVALLGLLATGRAASSFHGWIDRREWLNILRVVA